MSTRHQPGGLDEVLDLPERSAAFIRRTLATIGEERKRGVFKIVRAGRTLMSMPRADFLRGIMLNHGYHHRGQFGVCLRLPGGAVPSSHGPSGDEGLPS